MGILCESRSCFGMGVNPQQTLHYRHIFGKLTRKFSLSLLHLFFHLLRSSYCRTIMLKITWGVHFFLYKQPEKDLSLKTGEGQRIRISYLPQGDRVILDRPPISHWETDQFLPNLPPIRLREMASFLSISHLPARLPPGN